MKIHFLIYAFVFYFFIGNSAAAQPAKPACSCADKAALHSIDELLACYNEPRCNTQKLDIAVALRIKGRSLADAIKDYISLSNNAGLSQIDQKFYLEKIKQDRTRLIAIKENIRFEGYDLLIEPLYLDFDSTEKRYYRHYSSFNIGYEYAGLDKIFQKGLPRIGFLHYRRFGEAPATKEGLGYYGVHIFGNMQLTSSAEQAKSVDGAEIKNTVIISLSVFMPFFHSSINPDRSLNDLTGVLVTYGAKKNSTLERVNSRVYVGFRNAFNPETYIDATFGYTEGLSTSRIEIKAHLPVYKFSHGSRIFFGGTLNMSPPWAAATTDPDAIRFYLEWNADFGKIIDGVQSAFGV